MFTTLLIIACCYSFLGSLTADINSSEKYIDGTQHIIKSVGATYTQRVSHHGQCSVELNEQSKKSKLLIDGEIIKIKNKWFKVEECRLNRAYTMPCGSKLFYQLRDLACSFVEQHNDNKTRVPQQTNDQLIQNLDRSYYSACCESACTIFEFLQYCPTNW